MRPSSSPRHFQLVQRLALGRRSEIHLAETSDGEHVVLKIPLAAHRTCQDLASRFAAQLEISRAFRHEHVVRVLESGRAGGSPFLAMEYVRGATLRAIVSEARATRSRLPLSVALRVTLQVCRALVAAHGTVRPDLPDLEATRLGLPVSGPPDLPASGDEIVHGDLSLETVLLSPTGQIKILPFGCAAPSPSTAATAPAGEIGVPLHLAPEVVSGHRPDVRSDLWSLGSILYELCAPQLPEGFRTGRGPIGWWRLGLLPPLDQLRDDVPSEIAHLAAHLLDADPERRLQRAEFVEEELLWALTEHGDRRVPRLGRPADGEPSMDLEASLSPLFPGDDLAAPLEDMETLSPDADLDEDADLRSWDDLGFEAMDDTAGEHGIQLIGAAMAPSATAFTETDHDVEPLREVARLDGRRPPLVPDEELWLDDLDNPLLHDSHTGARATWSELQRWGDEVSTPDALDPLVQSVLEVDGGALEDTLWHTPLRPPTIAGLARLDAFVDTPRPAPTALRPPMPPAQAEPALDQRAELYFLIGSVALLLSAILLFASVVFR